MRRSAGRALRRFGAETRGGVAVEFGILASMLVPALVVAFDLGFLLRERVAMEHSIRAGIFAAMGSGSTQTSVETAIQTALEGQDSTRVSLESLSVVETCFCPDAPDQEVSCTASCAPDVVFGAYTISLALSYDSILMPAAVQSGLDMLSARVRVEFPAWVR
jgi:Flp pilus assembly protein TadG